MLFFKRSHRHHHNKNGISSNSNRYNPDNESPSSSCCNRSVENQVATREVSLREKNNIIQELQNNQIEPVVLGAVQR